MIYVEKLKETIYQNDLQKMISDISHDFAHVTKSNLRHHIDVLLSRTGAFWGADRSFIFMFDHDKDIMTIQYEWCRDGITPELSRLEPCPKSRCPNLMRRMTSFTPVYLEDVRKLQVDIVSDNELFLNKNVVSFVAAPIYSNNTLYGFIAMTTYASSIKIPQGDLEVLRTLAGLIASRLVMLRAERDIEQLAYYDNLTGLPIGSRSAGAPRRLLPAQKSRHLSWLYLFEPQRL
jgi:transcriptional regulator with GAF, ATPase, and Fis domain